MLESFGRFGDRTRDLFKQVVDRVQASKDQYSSSFLKQYWRARIVMALHFSASSGGRDRMNEVVQRRRGLSGNETVSVAAAYNWVDYEKFAAPATKSIICSK